MAQTTELSTHKYQLIVKVPFESLDDLEARKKVIEIVEKLDLDKGLIKLQEVFEDRPPRGVQL